MAEPGVPWPNTVSYTSNQFLVSAGCLLFRLAPDTHKLQLCAIFHTKQNHWLLPKGRKNCNESIEAAAVRETYEETGYPCELLPCRMATRATQHGVETPDTTAVVVDNAKEPVTVYVRQLSDNGVKLIWWFIARLKDNAEKVSGTQAAFEAYESHFLDVSTAISRLHFQNDRDLVQKAVEIIQATAELHGGGLAELFNRK
ncbi:hypothetical protein HGRIS_012946 [Hohenbuehelia grisea]|uniref:Nudix hydrolase domain-containing protein n=1 Tax=Hohenbuehelia grisea TaxID=104357 RepID=A0ABR3ITV1_9AGAR